MATRYRCPRCGKVYNTLPGDSLCKKTKCWEQGVQVEPIGEDALVREYSPVPEPAGVAGEAKPALIGGLCVLICDASNSMDNQAFRDDSADSRTRLRLVVDAVQGAIEKMVSDLSSSDMAYIAIIAYGVQAKLLKDRLGHPFIKSVREIEEQFGGPEARIQAEPEAWKQAEMETPDWSSLSREERQERYEAAFKKTYETAFKETCTLANYLHDEFEHDRQQVDRAGTNITAALRLAREIVDATLRSDLSSYGIAKSVSLIGQRPFHTPDEKVIEVPNVRAMIYSDGEHNQGTLENAFADMQPVSILMTAFIGDDLDEEGNTRPGAEDMRTLATICPTHRLAGYFLINDSERGEVLRDMRLVEGTPQNHSQAR